MGFKKSLVLSYSYWTLGTLIIWKHPLTTFMTGCTSSELYFYGVNFRYCDGYGEGEGDGGETLIYRLASSYILRLCL